jgi:hypothetical protein
MEGPFGRRPIFSTYPQFKLQYTQGVEGLLDGTLDFSRVDFNLRYDLKTKAFGISSLQLGAGKVWGDVPYSYLYTGRSNLPNVMRDLGRTYIADQFSFETMRNNEFLNDQYIQVFLRQNLQQRLFKIGSWSPDVELVARALWGTLNNPERHRGISVQEARNGFYEAGVEINKVYAGLGVGAYHRFGPYQLPTAIDNWSFKVTYRFVLFE